MTVLRMCTISPELNEDDMCEIIRGNDRQAAGQISLYQMERHSVESEN